MKEFEFESLNLMFRQILDLVTEEKKRTELEQALPTWINRLQAWKLKGGTTLATFRHYHHLQPCGGKNSVKIGGKTCWHQSEVIRWLGVTDETLAEYLQNFGVEILERKLPPELKKPLKDYV